jgi:hypothetical protein
MSNNAKEDAPPPPPPLPPGRQQTDTVNEIMSKVVSKQSADSIRVKIQFLLFICMTQLNCVICCWSHGLSMVWMRSRPIRRRRNTQSSAAWTCVQRTIIARSFCQI